MHRVELKVLGLQRARISIQLFLMHRVELKAVIRMVAFLQTTTVPNAPCGVESYETYAPGDFVHLVPNAPCGVESGLVLKTLKNKMGVGCNVF